MSLYLLTQQPCAFVCFKNKQLLCPCVYLKNNCCVPVFIKKTIAMSLSINFFVAESLSLFKKQVLCPCLLKKEEEKSAVSLCLFEKQLLCPCVYYFVVVAVYLSLFKNQVLGPCLLKTTTTKCCDPVSISNAIAVSLYIKKNIYKNAVSLCLFKKQTSVVSLWPFKEQLLCHCGY